MSEYVEQIGKDIQSLLGEYGELIEFRKARKCINRNASKARILVKTWPPAVKDIGDKIINNCVSKETEIILKLEEKTEESNKKGVNEFYNYITKKNPSLVSKLFDINLQAQARIKKIETDIKFWQKELTEVGEGLLYFLKKDNIAHTPAEVAANLLREDTYLVDLVLTSYRKKREDYDRNLQIFCDFDEDTLKRRAEGIIGFYYSRFLPVLKLLLMEGQIIKEKVSLNGRKKYGPHHILLSNKRKKIKKRRNLETERKSRIKGRVIQLAKKYIGEFRKRFPQYNLQIVTMGSIIPDFKIFSYYGDPKGDMKAVSDIDIMLYYKGEKLEYTELRKFTEEFSRKHKIHFSTPQRELTRENIERIRGIRIYGRWKVLGYRLAHKLRKLLD